MKTNTQIDIPKNFFITYFAKKHDKFITRKGTWTKPNTDTTVMEIILYLKRENLVSQWRPRRRWLENGNLNNDN